MRRETRELLKQMYSLAALALPALLLAGCEGGADSKPMSERTPLSEVTPGSAVGPGSVVRLTAADVTEIATRDLGLVDPNRGVRIGTAAADFGLLSVEQFGSALLDESPSVRQAAIDGIIGAPPEVLVAKISQLKQALSDQDESVRESVVEVLGGWDDPRAVALLLQARGDASPLVREEAAETLARLGSTRSEEVDEISFVSSD